MITTLPDNDDGLTDEQVDRLVDGELTLVERRALLEQVEASPNGWRRVGLAFLEAQSLRQTCAEWTAPIVIDPAVPFSPATKSVRQHQGGRFVTSAAALLMAFMAGIVTGHPWSAPSSAPAVVADAPVKKEPVEPAVPPEPVEAIPVTFRYGDGGISAPVTTPVVDATSPEGQAWLQASQGIPAVVQDMLRRQGQKLQERKEWVEIDLADGRRGYLPVQEWVVAPVSLADYR